MSRPTNDQTWLDVAQVIARRATCLRRAVGCVLIDARGHVLSTGYNGRAAGQPHCNVAVDFSPGPGRPIQIHHPYVCAAATAPSGTQLDGCEAIHGEQNALLQCRDVHAIDTCYVTVSPCVTCVKLLLNTSCQRIVFAKRYAHDEAASDLWLKTGRTWEVNGG